MRIITEFIEICFNQNFRWKVSGSRKNSNDPQKDATVELEVVSIEGLQYVGVKRRRLHGEPFTYKRICEEASFF